MKVLAPAKINLYLKVLSKRDDGYHEVRTIMKPVSLYDEIELEPDLEGVVLEACGCDCPVEENLAYRAARLFIAETGMKEGVRLRLVKHIPSGTGLGGGSSDAAHVLIALNELFGTQLSESELLSLAALLGADCPFFIHGRPALMGSRGDSLLSDVHLARRTYLLVIPPFGISTSRVYANLKIPLTLSQEVIKIEEIVKKTLAPEEILVNDLEGVAFELSPELATMKKELLAAGVNGALMSGSGSAVFGVCDGNDHCMDVMDRLVRREGYRYIPTT